MNRIAVVIAVVITCAVIASASALLAYYPLQTASPSSPASSMPTSSGLSNMYNAELTYVYTGRTNATGEGHDHFGWGIETYPANYYPVTVYLKLTYLGSQQNEPYDFICEGYLVNFTADTGATASYVGWQGTNYNTSSTALPYFSFTPWGPISSMYFHLNATINDSDMLRITDAGSFGSANGTLGLWSNGTPNTITVTVQRAGWLTATGNETSAVTNQNSAVLQQVQLQKSGGAFVFGSEPAEKIPFT